MFKNLEKTETRTAVEYGKNIIVIADTEKRFNFIYWRGERYYMEAIAVIPMPTANENWREHVWEVLFLDYEGDSAAASFNDFYSALNYCDRKAEEMLTGVVTYKRERGY